MNIAETATETALATDDVPPEVARARRPQWLVFMLFGQLPEYAGTAMSAGSFIETFRQLDVSSHAVRSTLSRMTDRGLLQRHRRGREMYYSLTRLAAEGLSGFLELADRPFEHSHTVEWTAVAFTVPENQRALRRKLRSRLSWGGFGLLRSGIWVSPNDVDVAPLVDGLDVMEYLDVFTNCIPQHRDLREIIGEAYDLDAIASRYTSFAERWGTAPPEDFSNPLAAILTLTSQWQQLARADPRLPLDHLPADWPAESSRQLFLTLRSTLRADAQTFVDDLAVLRTSTLDLD